MPEQSMTPARSIVYLDIRIGREDVGRVVIELFKDICPKTCENFRSLCVGDKGLCYRGSFFHKVIKLCHAQGGDITKFNGTSGESIYGKCFEDENFILKHEPGVVSMANFGKPHTNNSQFFITTVECPHLDGTNVVFGKVLKGLCVVNEMENISTDEEGPAKVIMIADCGEIKRGDNWGYCDDDGTPDTLPPFPSDWDDLELECSINEKIRVLEPIKASGNSLYRSGDYLKAASKYKKVTRYYNLYKDHTSDEEHKKTLDTFQLVNLTNLAATELKLGEYNDVRLSCNAAIKLDANHSKAFYRRGVANIELKNYEMALDDLNVANKLLPGDRAILKEFERAKKYLLEYRALEKQNLKKMFK